MTQSLALVHDAHEIPLTGRAVLIGRLAECDVLLDGAEVSRRHARIVPTPKGPLLQDRSRFGTWVNGSQVVAPHLLHEGDVIQIGPWVLNVSRASGLGASASAATAGWQVRLAQWRRRYGPSELTGTVAAVSVAVLVQRASGSLLLAAYAGTFAEMAWFYGVLALRDLRRARRDAARIGGTVDGHAARGVLRNIVLEFGAAEALDALLFRPLAIGLGLRFVGGLIGALAGKLAADALFYGPVLRFLYWRLAPGKPSEPAQNPERARRTTTNTRPPSLHEPGGDTP